MDEFEKKAGEVWSRFPASLQIMASAEQQTLVTVAIAHALREAEARGIERYIKAWCKMLRSEK